MKHSNPSTLFKKRLNKARTHFVLVLKKFKPGQNVLFKGIIGTLIGLFALSLVFYVLVRLGGFGPIPTDEELLSIDNPLATKIYTSDSVLMSKYYSQNRLDLKSHEITPLIKEALISTEDARFYTHKGIDYKSLFRVLIKTILLGDEDSGGGSTITQQLVKNLYPRKEYWLGSIFINKLKEMIVAQKLENLYSKEEILKLYLNTVPFGEQTFGIKAGSLRYFNKTPEQLEPAEAALLVGMLKGPTLFNPRINYGNAFRRRNVVLNQMSKSGMIDTIRRDSLMNKPIELDYHRPVAHSGIAPYFKSYLLEQTELILRQINKDGGKNYQLKTDGLSIYTSIDSRLQSYAEQAVDEHMTTIQKTMDAQWKNADWNGNPELAALVNKQLQTIGDRAINEKRKTVIFDWDGEKDTLLTPKEELIHNMSLLKSGFMVMDVKDGTVKAWVGGINYKYFKYDHVLAKRQVGSIFKPFLYLEALEQGFDACDVFFNDTITYAQYENWAPRNANRVYGDAYTLKGALTHSVNTISAHLIMKVGLSNVLKLAKEAGIQSTLPRVPSVALGTAELSLFEMVQAYQAIANYGTPVSAKVIQRIESSDGTIIYDAINHQKTSPRIANKTNVETLIEILKNVVTQGTAGDLKYKYHLDAEIAGKTGTTQNYADAWFIGFTPELVAGAWVGGDYPAIHLKDGEHGEGAHAALPIWANFFQRVYEDPHFSKMQSSQFSIPYSIKEKLDCDDWIEPPTYEEIKTKPVFIVNENE